MFQLRGQDQDGVDTGEIIQCETLEEAFEKFLDGGFWKLSWQRKNGHRVRLFYDGNSIQITQIIDKIEEIG
jgi:hypothetical protein